VPKIAGYWVGDKSMKLGTVILGHMLNIGALNIT